MFGLKTRNSLTCFTILVLLASLFVPMGVSAVNEWQPNTPYQVGSQVTYLGNTYECIQKHTSLAGWEPPNVPALWKHTGSGGGDKDTQVPTTPRNLSSPSQTESSISLTWDASTDNIGVIGYDVYRGSQKVATTSTTNYTDLNLIANTAYSYQIQAKDAAGNKSNLSSVFTISTKSSGSNPSPPNKKIVAYYPGWATYGRNYQVSSIDGSKITHINYAFANVQNGEVVVGDTYADTDKFFPGDCWDTGCKRGNFNQLTKLKQRYSHVKILISVGGWTWSAGFSDAALTDASRTKFADSAVRFIRTWGFDGVDIDWEYPVSGGLQNGRPEDRENFTLLLQKMREKLDAASEQDGKKYLLTIASGAGSSYVKNTELGKIKDYLDWINIMTYDYHGGWEKVSGHNAPLYRDNHDPSPNKDTFNVEAGVYGHLNAGVPPSKLVLGLPFYGRGWSGCANFESGQYQSCSSLPQGTWEAGVFDFTDLESNYINKSGYNRYWNDTAKVPYLWNSSTQTFISYDDVESIGYKTSFLKSKGLAGAMFWELSADRNKTLLNKVYSDLK